MPTVKLFANLRKIAGTKEVSVTAASVGEVISELVKRHPALAESLLADRQIRQHIIVTINGHPTDDAKAPVVEGDTLAIFPPITGG
jgi:MoaD family protein